MHKVDLDQGVQRFVGEFNPTWIVEELVEIFELIFINGQFFLSEKEGIDRRVQFLFEKANGWNCVGWVEMRVFCLSVKSIQTFDDF